MPNPLRGTEARLRDGSAWRNGGRLCTVVVRSLLEATDQHRSGNKARRRESRHEKKKGAGIGNSVIFVRSVRRPRQSRGCAAFVQIKLFILIHFVIRSSARNPAVAGGEG